jgi:hypothetical protein
MNSESNATDQSATGQPATPAVGSRVLVKGSDGTSAGVVVDDFGTQVEDAVVDLGDGRKTRPRRWAVALDDGGLAFVDDDGLELETVDPATLEG